MRGTKYTGILWDQPSSNLNNLRAGKAPLAIGKPARTRLSSTSQTVQWPQLWRFFPVISTYDPI